MNWEYQHGERKSMKNFRIFIAVPAILMLSFNFAAAAGTTQYQSHAGRFHSADISSNWSGYVAKGRFTGVTGSWIVPKVRNSRAVKTDSAWVGIGGVSSADLIQAGTEETTGIAGQPVYQAWVETLPDYAHPISLTIAPGDQVNVEIKQEIPGQWNINFKNLTSGQNFQKRLKYNSSLSSAEWIEEVPTGPEGLMTLDNFKTVRFGGVYAYVGNKKISAAAASAKPVRLGNSKGKIISAPTHLDISAFEVKRMPG